MDALEYHPYNAYDGMLAPPGQHWPQPGSPRISHGLGTPHLSQGGHRPTFVRSAPNSPILGGTQLLPHESPRFRPSGGFSTSPRLSNYDLGSPLVGSSPGTPLMDGRRMRRASIEGLQMRSPYLNPRAPFAQPHQHSFGVSPRTRSVSFSGLDRPSSFPTPSVSNLRRSPSASHLPHHSFKDHAAYEDMPLFPHPSPLAPPRGTGPGRMTPRHSPRSSFDGGHSVPAW
jgi:hypothetical protein